MGNKNIKRGIILTIIMVNIFLFINIWPALYQVFAFILTLLLPFIIGFTLAFIILPAVRFLEKKKIPKRISITIIMVAILAVVVGVIWLLVPMLLEEFSEMFDKVPHYANIVYEKIDELCSKLGFFADDFLPTKKEIEDIMHSNLTKIIQSMIGIVQKTFSYFIIFILSIVLTIYFLFDFERIIKWVKSRTSETQQGFVMSIRDTMQAYFKGVILVSFIMIVLATIGFLIVDLDYALILGIIVGITDIIPYLGPYLGGSIAFIVALSVSYKKAIIVILIILVIQTLESWVITPRIQSKATNIHPILVLFSLLLFGELFGVFGMLIAVPALSVIQAFVKKMFTKEKFH